MQFAISHDFEAPPDRVAAAILDPTYQASLADVSDALASREVLSQGPGADGTTVRRTRCVLSLDLGPAARFIGNSEPAWIEEATWHPEALRWDWVIQPEVAADLLAAEGTIALGPSDAGTTRLVTGDVRVRVPLYGGRVETAIVARLERAYSQEAERLAQWVTPT